MLLLLALNELLIFKSTSDSLVEALLLISIKALIEVELIKRVVLLLHVGKDISAK